MSKILPTGCSVFLTTTQLNQGQKWNPKSIDALCPVFLQSVGNIAKKQPQKLLSLAQKWPVNKSGMDTIGGLKAKGTYIRLEVWELWEEKKISWQKLSTDKDVQVRGVDEGPRQGPRQACSIPSPFLSPMLSSKIPWQPHASWKPREYTQSLFQR